jgi:exodeoxyribonuclease VII small subunit
MMSADDARAGEQTAAGDPTDAAPSFSAAMKELQSILERIDGDAIDIDQLADELRRATELLELCRGKIRKADVEVNQIVKQLEDSGEG